MTPRTRKLLVVIRAALIMATKAIEEYIRDADNPATIVPTIGEDISITQIERRENDDALTTPG